ncbi:hypothetical protein J3R73_006214 [Labrys monachus]|uniref:Uncharacterized protein n=1 Tax=Labrys monachus TaxID=217067 RepID=A0ABU0FPY7_9HYPH|nr:hypothetical protein [Labrys monachus]
MRNRGLACCARPPSPLSRRAGTRQQATRRGPAVSHRSGPSLRPEPGLPDGRHRRRRRARFPPSPATPDRPRALHRFRAREASRDAGLTHGTGGTGALADGLYLRRTPPAEQPGPRAAAAADAAGRVCRPPASDKAIRPGRPALPFSRTVRQAAGASPVSRGIEGRPEGGPIPARSSSSPVCRPDGRVIAHPALPDVGGPGIAPEEDAMGRSAAIPLSAGPVLVSKPGRNGQAP